jgi:hypothetical protein
VQLRVCLDVFNVFSQTVDCDGGPLCFARGEFFMCPLRAVALPVSGFNAMPQKELAITVQCGLGYHLLFFRLLFCEALDLQSMLQSRNSGAELFNRDGAGHQSEN